MRFVIFYVLCLLSFPSISQVWEEVMKITASDRAWADGFGSSVKIVGDFAIVGVQQSDLDTSGGNYLSNAGAAYIFHKNGQGIWEETQKLVASDRGDGDKFGVSVDLSGNRAIIGAYVASGFGAAYIFEMDGSGHWHETQKIMASNTGTAHKFGYSVGISQDYAVVGAYYDSEDASGSNMMFYSGSAYVFEFDSVLNSWSETQKIVAADRAQQDYFGKSVSISGDKIIVGAPSKNYLAFPINVSGAGAAFIFERTNLGVWQQTQKLISSDKAQGDLFGSQVCIDSNKAIVSAPDEDENASGSSTINDAGSVYIFDRGVNGIWSETQKIVASDRQNSDRFGLSLNISGNRLIVGVPHEDHDVLGANGMTFSGSAYIFDRSNIGVWQQVQKIVASDRAVQDGFGSAVSVSGNQLIVTALAEDEDAQGLNTLSAAGSAYVFCSPNAPPSLDSLMLSDIYTDCQIDSLIPPTATDDCGKKLFGTTNVAFPITAQGETVITWTFTDIIGNTISQTHSVYIIDSIAPVPDSSSLPDVLSQCDITALVAPTSTDNCTGQVVVTNDATFPITNLGTTVVQWSYSDNLGNTSTQYQNVILSPDTTSPIPNLSVLPDVISECEITNLVPPTASDDCVGLISVTSDANLPIQNQGITVVTWTYTDEAGNSSMQMQNVNVSDVSGPVPDLSILPDVLGECEVDSLIFPTATDNCGGSITITNNAVLPITTIGQTIVIWTFQDANGNSTTQTQNVNVTCDLGVEESQAEKVQIFPNPAQKVITVSSQGDFDIELTDFKGRLLFRQENIHNQLIMNMDNYPVGFYFIRVFVQDKWLTFKMVKQ